MKKLPSFLFYLLLVCSLCLSCASKSEKSAAYPIPAPKGSFGYDLQFLQAHDSVVVLKAESEAAQVIVSPRYQAKVFTSTAEGLPGKSFGWINYKAFTAPLDSHMNAYGGENRLWLGPEGGPFSLFFPKGAEMSFPNWKTPAPIDTEPWTVVRKSDTAVHLQKPMQLTNYAGTVLQLTADRKIAILDRAAVRNLVQQSFDTSVKAVGYQTTNTIANTGTQEWNQQTGAPCIWMLNMFNPSAKTIIVIPYEGADTGKIATTDYFGAIPSERVRFANGVLFFKADGKSRGKLGFSPMRAKPLAGSYDAEANVLTIAFFDVDKTGSYLNQEWTTGKPPFTGDAVNAYNDGPLEDGKQMGPFYEIESVSPAAFLKPGQSLTHHHTVIHLTGNKEVLDKIAQKQFGVSLAQIQKAL